MHGFDGRTFILRSSVKNHRAAWPARTDRFQDLLPARPGQAAFTDHQIETLLFQDFMKLLRSVLYLYDICSAKCPLQGTRSSFTVTRTLIDKKYFDIVNHSVSVSTLSSTLNRDTCSPSPVDRN